jgi:hypothetical protein
MIIKILLICLSIGNCVLLLLAGISAFAVTNTKDKQGVKTSYTSKKSPHSLPEHLNKWQNCSCCTSQGEVVFIQKKAVR